MVHSEAVVMLGRIDKILHTGICGKLHPLPGVKVLRAKRCRKRPIAFHRNLQMTHDPFGHIVCSPAVPYAAKHGVQTPVHEHTKRGVFPPFLFAVFHLSSLFLSNRFRLQRESLRLPRRQWADPLP